MSNRTGPKTSSVYYGIVLFSTLKRALLAGGSRNRRKQTETDGTVHGGLITRRSQVQILPPLLRKGLRARALRGSWDSRMTAPATVLITGCSSGIGWAAATALLERGHTVIATMRDVGGKNAGAAAELQAAAESAPGRGHVLELDVTQDDSVEAGVEAALGAERSIDVLVNNAGYGGWGLLEGFTSEQLSLVFETNVIGTHRLNRAVLPGMRERGSGLLIHLSSAMGRIVIPYAAPYTSTKFAIEALAESLHYELAGTGVDVSILQPGAINTDFRPTSRRRATARASSSAVSSSSAARLIQSWLVSGVILVHPSGSPSTEPRSSSRSSFCWVLL